jgi:hypothetical protein
VTHLRRAAELSPGASVVQGYLGYVLAKGGDRVEANRIVAELTRNDRRGATAGAVAQVLTGLGETEKALDYLERAVKERSNVLLSPRVLRSLDALKTNPRFAEIMRWSGPSAGGRGVPNPRADSLRRAPGQTRR